MVRFSPLKLLFKKLTVKAQKYCKIFQDLHSIIAQLDISNFKVKFEMSTYNWSPWRNIGNLQSLKRLAVLSDNRYFQAQGLSVAFCKLMQSFSTTTNRGSTAMHGLPSCWHGLPRPIEEEMVDPLQLQSLSTNMTKGSASMILTRSFRQNLLTISDYVESRLVLLWWAAKNDCSKREPFNVQFYNFYFYLKCGKKQTFYVWKNNKCWWKRFINCWYVYW